jgi:CRP/FNR family transcriptional regulator
MLDDREVARAIDAYLVCPHDFCATCDTCRLRALCLPAALGPEEIALLESVIERRRLLNPGDHLYRKHQKFTSLYAMISGAIKTYTIHSDGWMRITGCHLPGEMFGFSGIDQAHYSSNAKALTHTCVCELPFAELETLCLVMPGLQSRLLHLMSRRIVEDHALIAQFFDKSPAKKRIAAFILSLSSRAARRGESATHIHLPMTRKDIGNYLGVSIETVSRELSRLRKRKIIVANDRDITILDAAQLRRPVCGISG